jgi:hypothetical protein
MSQPPWSLLPRLIVYLISTYSIDVTHLSSGTSCGLGNFFGSMSRILWVWFLCCLKSVRREVAPERHSSVLLNAISMAKVLALVSSGKILTALVLLFTSLNRRSSMLVVRSLAWWLPGKEW